MGIRMAEIFIHLVKQMVIFLIAGQTILHFGIGRQYERYVRLILSLMLVTQLLSAAVSILPAGQELDIWGSGKGIRESFRSDWEDNMEQFEKKLYQKQEELEDWQKRRMQETSEEESMKDSRQIKVEEITIQ